jgi:thioredoxin-like negative regulator of GroEL
MTSGAKIKAFNMYRKIGRKHMKDPRALKAWSEAAASMRGYGEALRVARRWVTADKSDEARLHLAKMQRMCGQRNEALKTLHALIKEKPGNEEAKGMLRTMVPEPRIARR